MWFVVKSSLLLGKQGRIIQGASSSQGIRDQTVTQRKKAGWFGSHLGNACPGFFLPWQVSWEGVPPGPEAGARRDQENTRADLRDSAGWVPDHTIKWASRQSKSHAGFGFPGI